MKITNKFSVLNFEVGKFTKIFKLLAIFNICVPNILQPSIPTLSIHHHKSSFILCLSITGNRMTKGNWKKSFVLLQKFHFFRHCCLLNWKDSFLMMNLRWNWIWNWRWWWVVLEWIEGIKWNKVLERKFKKKIKIFGKFLRIFWQQFKIVLILEVKFSKILLPKNFRQFIKI